MNAHKTPIYNDKTNFLQLMSLCMAVEKSKYFEKALFKPQVLLLAPLYKALICNNICHNIFQPMSSIS